MQEVWLWWCPISVKPHEHRVRGRLGETVSVTKGDRRLDKMANTPAAFVDTRTTAPHVSTTAHSCHRPLDGGRMVDRQAAVAQGRQRPHTRDMETALATLAGIIYRGFEAMG